SSRDERQSTSMRSPTTSLPRSTQSSTTPWRTRLSTASSLAPFGELRLVVTRINISHTGFAPLVRGAHTVFKPRLYPVDELTETKRSIGSLERADRRSRLDTEQAPDSGAPRGWRPRPATSWIKAHECVVFGDPSLFASVGLFTPGGCRRCGVAAQPLRVLSRNAGVHPEDCATDSGRRQLLRAEPR